MRCEMQGISNDIYLTVVSLCKGYRRRKQLIDRSNEEGASSSVKKQAEKLNGIVADAVNECCCEWLAYDMIDCIGDMTGFRKYRKNHLISKYAYDRYKRDSVLAIARRLELL